MKVVFEELLFHGWQRGHGYPLRQRRIIGRRHFRQLARLQVKIVRMRDGAPALAAVRMVEHGHADQRLDEGGRQHAQLGFFRQFAQGALQQAFARLQKAAGQGPQTLARIAATAHQ